MGRRYGQSAQRTAAEPGFLRGELNKRRHWPAIRLPPPRSTRFGVPSGRCWSA
ncbi:hypothetical protein I553_9443 [Mycobacterium xenopi 4042]|uniref:Uncharacterized protein n=1 Tax=Mycobacterium xenopi 4042 TaxID=1299334 RepID=X8DXE3_MYCXE|nr:hypothetical protein I553_9443 [Mycobacterium xenopi 4042]